MEARLLAEEEHEVLTREEPEDVGRVSSSFGALRFARSIFHRIDWMRLWTYDFYRRGHRFQTKQFQELRRRNQTVDGFLCPETVFSISNV